MQRICLPLVVMLILVSLSGCSSQKTDLVLKGVVETHLYAHYSEAAGKITELPIELGQEVKAGDVIAIIDNSNQKYTLEQLETTLDKKKAALAELERGTDQAEIKQGQNNVTIAEQAYASSQILLEKAQIAYDKAESLYEGGGISKSVRDEAKYQLDLAQMDVTTKRSQLDNAHQKLVLLGQGASQEKIAAAQADIAQTESQIRQAQENLAKCKITAVSAGTIISKNYLLGDIVAAGYNLADIASNTEKYLVAYLPEDYLHRVSYAQEVVVKRGEEQFQGTVNFIDAKAQYTPKEMQTAANKNKDSVKIKVLLAPEVALKVGEKAELVIPLARN